MQLFWKHRSAWKWNSFPDMEVTCIYCKHYPTYKFGNETRVRQEVQIPVRASLQLEVNSAAKAYLSPPACPLSQKHLLSLDHFVCVSDWVGKTFICTDIWWGLLTCVTHQLLACGEGEVRAPIFAQTQEIAANYLKVLGLIQDHVPCSLYKKARLEGVSLMWKSGKTFMAIEWSGYFLNARAQREFSRVRSRGNPSSLPVVVYMASKPCSANHPKHVLNLREAHNPFDCQK